MNVLLCLTILSLVHLMCGAPSPVDDEESRIISKDMFSDAIIFLGDDEIDLFLNRPINNIINEPLNGLLNGPLNGLLNGHLNNLLNININIPEDTQDYLTSEESEMYLIVLFLEAEIDSNGNLVEHGVYAIKDGKSTKILEHGRDMAASMDSSNLAFFGTKNGIYKYDEMNNSAVKYGSVDDSIISIEAEITGNSVYILTEKRELFKISDAGMKKEKINDVTNAREFKLDFSNNIYFYTDDKQTYVRTADGVKKVEGLPKNPSNVKFSKPSTFISETNAVPFIVDDGLYILYANGTSSHCDIKFDPKTMPSAYAPDIYLVQHYSKKNNIYEMNIFDTLDKRFLGNDQPNSKPASNTITYE